MEGIFGGDVIALITLYRLFFWQKITPHHFLFFYMKTPLHSKNALKSPEMLLNIRKFSR